MIGRRIIVSVNSDHNLTALTDPHAVIDHLQVIHRTAPDRVGIYGLVNSDKSQSDQSKVPFHKKEISDE